MRDWTPAEIADAAGATLVAGADARGGAQRVVIDSREAGEGDLFVALPGRNADGGAFAAGALEAGAWGVLVEPSRARELAGAAGVVLASPSPLAALHALARSWRRALGATVVGVTGSVGKTSTKELLAGLLAPHRRVVASRENRNTEIGLPLELLRAPAGTEVLVLELAMRGAGQIAELAAICEPDVGVVTNVGPVHLEQLGSIEGIGRAKGELLEGLRDGAVAVVPDGEALLAHALRPALDVRTFGADPGADAHWVAPGRVVSVRGEERALELPFTAGPQLSNALAAVLAAEAVGVRPEGRIEVASVALRGERIALADGSLVVVDCYNASPPSMQAALEELSREEPPGRRVAVLGDMLELGPQEAALHRAVGEQASAAGVELLIAVGPRAEAIADAYAGPSHRVADASAAAVLADVLVAPGDAVLVKASNGVGLWTVAERLRDARGTADDG